jgi:hypothetical protein
MEIYGKNSEYRCYTAFLPYNHKLGISNRRVVILLPDGETVHNAFFDRRV